VRPINIRLLNDDDFYNLADIFSMYEEDYSDDYETEADMAEAMEYLINTKGNDLATEVLDEIKSLEELYKGNNNNG